MKIVKNKNGTVVILVTLFFVTLQSLIIGIIYISRDLAIEGGVKSLGQLHAQSILAEYDRTLYDRYRIFGFYGEEFYTRDRLEFYFGKSLSDKEYIDYEVDSLNLQKYTLLDVNNLQKQINETIVENILSPIIYEPNIVSNDPTIRNSRIISELPSNMAGVENRMLDIDLNIKEPQDSINLHLYVHDFFKNALNAKGLGETFFNYEIEYLIAGEMSDSKNLQSIKNSLTAFRIAANTAYILTDPTKVALATSMATISVGPGPQLIAAKYAILVGWATTEAVNDVNTLLNGGKVPLLKSVTTWGIGMSCHSGLNYDDYLKAMLISVSKNTKLYRILDLIQMNLILSYDKDFLIKDYYTGIEFSMAVNNKLIKNKNEY